MTRPSLSDVSSPRGAPMGRHSTWPVPLSARVSVRRVRLDAGGYDSGGAYWGVGRPLYWAEWDGGDVFFRATDRATALSYIETQRAAP